MGEPVAPKHGKGDMRPCGLGRPAISYCVVIRKLYKQ